MSGVIPRYGISISEFNNLGTSELSAESVRSAIDAMTRFRGNSHNSDARNSYMHAVAMQEDQVERMEFIPYHWQSNLHHNVQEGKMDAIEKQTRKLRKEHDEGWKKRMPQPVVTGLTGRLVSYDTPSRTWNTSVPSEDIPFIGTATVTRASGDNDTTTWMDNPMTRAGDSDRRRNGVWVDELPLDSDEVRAMATDRERLATIPVVAVASDEHNHMLGQAMSEEAMIERNRIAETEREQQMIDLRHLERMQEEIRTEQLYARQRQEEDSETT